MSPSFEVSNFLLVSIAILFCIVSLLSILGNNHTHTRSNRRKFVYKVAVFAIVYLLHLLSEASISVGTNRRSNKSIHWLECLYSNKGGKRPFGDTSDEYRNPCFNITDNKTESNNDDFGHLSPLDSLTLCSSQKPITMTIRWKLNHTYPQHVVTKLNEGIAPCPSLVLHVNFLDVMNSTVQIHHTTMMAGQDVRYARYATATAIVTL